MTQRGSNRALAISLISFPLVPKYPEILSSAERDVIERIMRLESNEEIAAARGTSVNTVGNQIASIFQKLDVNSRAELARKLHRSCATCRLASCLACDRGQGVTP